MNLGSIEGNTQFTGVDLIRWGQDGLAALTSSGNIHARAVFVVPQLLYNQLRRDSHIKFGGSITMEAAMRLL